MTAFTFTQKHNFALNAINLIVYIFYNIIFSVFVYVYTLKRIHIFFIVYNRLMRERSVYTGVNLWRALASAVNQWIVVTALSAVGP